eukprot:CAMPEP_0194550424 /NCGR_PEP_ID=MMETSP0253-20130528/95700_1 /TAXON_ID=2966 /ORGANISM="Noctiluca scintillans" /LENGTH=703 /DNA_ID=CAMNT_0039397863 /DNA_START=56 /DNA_END=2167 /DNA_ORIENTATION=+
MDLDSYMAPRVSGACEKGAWTQTCAGRPAHISSSRCPVASKDVCPDCDLSTVASSSPRLTVSSPPWTCSSPASPAELSPSVYLAEDLADVSRSIKRERWADCLSESDGGAEEVAPMSIPELRVRNTFLEVHLQPPAKRRAQSAPAFAWVERRMTVQPLWTAPCNQEVTHRSPSGVSVAHPKSSHAPQKTSGLASRESPSRHTENAQSGRGSRKGLQTPVVPSSGGVNPTCRIGTSTPRQHRQPKRGEIPEDIVAAAQKRPGLVWSLACAGSTSSLVIQSTLKAVAKSVAATSRKHQQPKRGEIPEDIVAMAQKRPGLVWSLACAGSTSSLVIQSTLKAVAKSVAEAASQEARARALADLHVLVQEFEGHEIEAALHPSANFLLNLALDVVPPSMMEFVAAPLLGEGVRLSKSRVGCRIMIRIFRHLLPSGLPAAVQLGQELLPEASRLLAHEFGNYVVQELFLRGTAADRQKIIEALCGAEERQRQGSELLRNATRVYASRVLQYVLRNSSEEIFAALSDELLRSTAIMRTMVKSPEARAVALTISTLLVAGDSRKDTLDALLAKTKPVALRLVTACRRGCSFTYVAVATGLAPLSCDEAIESLRREGTVDDSGTVPLPSFAALSCATPQQQLAVLQYVLRNSSEEICAALSDELLRSNANLQTLVKSPAGRAVALTVSPLLAVGDSRKHTLDAVLAKTKRVA